MRPTNPDPHPPAPTPRPPRSPQSWLLWAVAASGVATMTRNPILLALLLLVVLVVGARATPPSIIGRGWWLTGRLVAWLAGLSALLNLLTTRVGDRPLVSLPRDWPLLGGDLTWNALLYGLLAALSLLTVLAAWGVFNAAVSQGDLLGLVPRPLYLAGAAAAIALTFVPGMIRAAREIGEAQAVRGHRPRGPRDLAPLAVPLLSLGLERGLSLAEAMEARGFGAVVDSGQWGVGGGGDGSRVGPGSGSQPEERHPRTIPAGTKLGHPHPRPLPLPEGVVPASSFSPSAVLHPRSSVLIGMGLAGLALGGALVLVSPWPALGGVAVVGGGLALWWGLRRAGPGRSRYRRARWGRGDTLVAGLALLTVVLLVVARLVGDVSLDYSVYPTLAPPPVSGWVLALPVPLLGPALAAELERA